MKGKKRTHAHARARTHTHTHKIISTTYSSKQTLLSTTAEPRSKLIYVVCFFFFFVCVCVCVCVWCAMNVILCLHIFVVEAYAYICKSDFVKRGVLTLVDEVPRCRNYHYYYYYYYDSIRGRNLRMTFILCQSCKPKATIHTKLLR